MELGTAIKTIRKEKHITQKELAQMCEMSVNALCNIENNISFPQKATISLLCEKLQIPTSYLLFLSISEEDIPSDKQAIFKALSEPIRQVILDEVK